MSCYGVDLHTEECKHTKHNNKTTITGFPTTLESDLQRMWGAQDPRMQALVRYRYERKKLISAAESLLAVYAGKKTLF